MLNIEKALKRVAGWYNGACRRAVSVAERHSSSLLFILGVLLLVGGLENLANAQAGGGAQRAGNAVGACGLILQYIETGFGALVASAAGIGAIIAAAVGGFKAAWGLLVVSIGSFILRAYLTLFHSGC